MDSVVGGIGGYAKIDLPERVRAGVSVVHSWGSHDIVVAGAAGSFSSKHWTVEGSIARPYDLAGFVVTPMALMTYQHHSLGAYVDSNAMAVPGITDSTLDLSAVADIAYPMARDGDLITMVTPRFTIRTNFHVMRADAVAVGPLLFEQTRVTVDLSGGVAFSLRNGGSVDLALGAAGLAGDSRAYSLRGTFNMPLN
jgi:hypothetical protein